MPGPEDVCDRRYWPGIITSEYALRNDPQLKNEVWSGPGHYMVGKGKVAPYPNPPEAKPVPSPVTTGGWFGNRDHSKDHATRADVKAILDRDDIIIQLLSQKGL